MVRRGSRRRSFHRQGAERAGDERMLKKLINGEIAFGFALASLFWIAVLAWATSDFSTDQQKKDCYQAAAKSGHGTDECKSFWERTRADPVALFTLVLALSTVGLWTATIGLYRAGERQLKFAKETTANQAAQISDQIKVARQSADAATKAADVGEKSLRAAERAYLGLERVDLDGFYIGYRPRIASKIVNSGRTHGTIIEFAHTISVAENIPEIPSYDRIVHDQFLVRPGGEVSVLHFIGNDALTTETHRAVILGEESVFYWGKVTYRTEFDEIYELGFATQIVLEALGERERWGINAPQNRSSYFFNRRKEL
jgi:hypothetical protein